MWDQMETEREYMYGLVTLKGRWCNPESKAIRHDWAIIMEEKLHSLNKVHVENVCQKTLNGELQHLINRLEHRRKWQSESPV